MGELPRKYVDSLRIQRNIMDFRRFSENLLESIRFGGILMDTGRGARKKRDIQVKWSQRVSGCRFKLSAPVSAKIDLIHIDIRIPPISQRTVPLTGISL